MFQTAQQISQIIQNIQTVSVQLGPQQAKGTEASKN